MNSLAMPSLLALEQAGGVEYCQLFLDWLSFEGSLCLHFPQLLSSPELRFPLSDAHHARSNPMPHRRGNIIRSHFFDSAQKKILALTGMLLPSRQRLWADQAYRLTKLRAVDLQSAWTGFCLTCS